MLLFLNRILYKSNKIFENKKRNGYRKVVEILIRIIFSNKNLLNKILLLHIFFKYLFILSIYFIYDLIHFR